MTAAARATSVAGAQRAADPEGAHRPADAEGATYLVTGAMGCLGAWVTHHLVAAGRRTVAFDLSDDRRRLDLLLAPEEQRAVTFVAGDLIDTDTVARVVEEHGVTRIVHLAALQIPFCRANPVVGSLVNVVGFVNVFEAARRAGVGNVAYASSAAVYGPATRYPAARYPADQHGAALLPADAPLDPLTLYGAYKQADEAIARVYALEHGIASIGLRPYTVYGLGRDQGVTSEPTVAMLNAARGKDATISFGGAMQFHFASDVAHAFIAAADAGAGDGPAVGGGAPGDGAAPQPAKARALTFNLGGDAVTVEDVAALIEGSRPGVRVSVGAARLPFAAGMSEGALHEILPGLPSTSIEDGVRATLEAFTACLEDGRLPRA